MATIFGIDFPGLMSGVFDGQLEAGILETSTDAVDDYGQPVPAWVQQSVQGTITSWKEETRIERGWPLSVAKVIILAQGVVMPPIGARVTMRGQRFEVLDVLDGGAEAIWEVAGVPA